MSIIACYSPTKNSPEERKDDYEELQSEIDEIPEKDMNIVTCDFDAKVERNNQCIEGVMVSVGLGEVAYENEAHFISFCSKKNLVIGSILLQRKIHKYTWTSPGSNYESKEDHIAINKRRRILENVRSYRYADIGSAHQLLIATLILKLKAPNRNVDRIPRFDIANLLEDYHRETFAIECRNRFAVLETLIDEE
ncbi:craniofacial development protein 2-like [Palaemon carinicauda]|uniref:craniofacial development protein 2-like n=1 Tax=Palaemon carinicauda TaxID=392227 RepID=UPI0035B63080